MLTTKEIERLAYIQNEPFTHHLTMLDDAETSEEFAQWALAHISEARSAYPSEDVLRPIIEQVQELAQSRVTKAHMVDLIGMLEELQTSIGHAVGYGLDELNKAEENLVAMVRS